MAERPAQLRLERRQVPRQQLVSRRLITGGPRPRHAGVGLRHAQAEVVGLHAAIRGADRVGRPRHDFGQQLPGRIERRHRGAKLVQRRVLPHARERLVVLAGALAAPGERHPGLRHEVAFVGRVGEHLRAKRGAVFHQDVRHARARLAHAGLLAQPMVEEDSNAGVLDELAEHRLGDVGLEVPLDRAPVFAPDVLEELERVPADHFLPAVVGPAEAAGHHAAQVLAGLEERDVQPFARGRDGGDHAAGRAAVHHDIEILRRLVLASQRQPAWPAPRRGSFEPARGTAAYRGRRVRRS